MLQTHHDEMKITQLYYKTIIIKSVSLHRSLVVICILEQIKGMYIVLTANLCDR